MTSKNVRTEIVVSCWADGQRIWRTVDTIAGDVSGTMTVPSIEEAQQELKLDWKRFDQALNTHGRRLEPKERQAIEEATGMIEGSNRWLATAVFMQALATLHDSGIGTYFVVPQRRVPTPTDEEAES